MTRKEYKEILNYEIFCYHRMKGEKPGFIDRIRAKFFQPNTNCIYLARKMWFLYGGGFISKIRAKFLYIKILKKYGCVIYPNAIVGRGFHICHPVGIVIGNCTIGDNFMIYQNCTVGSGMEKANPKTGSTHPLIGNNVSLCANSSIIGGVCIVDNVVIGAHSLVIKDIEERGTYVGAPVKRVK